MFDLLSPGKHHVYGIGRDVTLPVVIKQQLIALVTLRYEWETGARTNLEGHPFNGFITVLFFRNRISFLARRTYARFSKRVHHA